MTDQALTLEQEAEAYTLGESFGDSIVKIIGIYANGPIAKAKGRGGTIRRLLAEVRDMEAGNKELREKLSVLSSMDTAAVRVVRLEQQLADLQAMFSAERDRWESERDSLEEELATAKAARGSTPASTTNLKPE